MSKRVNLIPQFDHFSYKSRTSGAQVETGGLRKTMTSPEAWTGGQGYLHRP